jgi:microcystin degradation protein MlrC
VENSARPLRVGIGGLHIESSVFSPHRTELGDFRVVRGEELLRRYDWAVGTAPPWADNTEWVPLLHASALPGGAVVPGCYSALRQELAERAAAAGRLDGVLLDIHGAMSVEGLQDAEADLTADLRGALDDDVLFSAAMDLHGNVSRELFGLLDLMTCYRTAPHVDTWETRERAVRNLVRCLRGTGRPHKAWVPVPVLLPGEKTSTRLEPAKGLYARLPLVENSPGVLDAAIWVGYAWADEPRCRAAVVVTGDSGALVAEHAEELARSYWDAREQFDFVAPAADFSWCLDEALHSAKRPFFISDSGDNPTAGGAGDVSFVLRKLLAEPDIASGRCHVVYASVVDPGAVATAFATGEGGHAQFTVGGKIDPGPVGPVALSGTVSRLRGDDEVGGDVAVISAGGLDLVLTSRRKPFHLVSDFARLGVHLAETEVVVVKIGYLEPELYAAAADWLLALTPGGVDQDLSRLGHRQLDRPVYPLDPDMPTPALRALVG